MKAMRASDRLIVPHIHTHPVKGTSSVLLSVEFGDREQQNRITAQVGNFGHISSDNARQPNLSL